MALHIRHSTLSLLNPLSPSSRPTSPVTGAQPTSPGWRRLLHLACTSSVRRRFLHILYNCCAVSSSCLCLFLWIKFFMSILLLRLWKYFRVYQTSIPSGLLSNFIIQIKICSNKFCVSAIEKCFALGVQKMKTSCNYMQIIPILKGNIWWSLSHWTIEAIVHLFCFSWLQGLFDVNGQRISRNHACDGCVSSIATLVHSLSDFWLSQMLHKVFQ